MDTKQSLSNRLQEILQETLDKENVPEDQIRLTRTSNLVFEVKVREEEHGAPRYFSVKVSELM